MCEVCHEPVVDLSKLSPEIREQVYKPGEDEVTPIEIHRTPDGEEPSEPDFVLEVADESE